jgi:hypothetical protein
VLKKRKPHKRKEEKMLTNELKKGTRIKLRNGWEADLWDNKKGNTRVANVYGFCTEAGSVYSHDIVAYKDKDGNWKNDIEYTESQLKCKKMNESLFG